MVSSTLLMLGGEGRGALTIKLQSGLGGQADYRLFDLAAGGTLLVGDATRYLHFAVDGKRGTCTLPSLEQSLLWAAYVGQDGHVLAWGTADGRWHECVAQFAMAFDNEHRTPPQKEADAPSVEAAEQPQVDLTQLGVTEVLTEDTAYDEQAEAVAEDAADGQSDVLHCLETYPHYAPLEEAIAGSRWVLVDEGDGAYLVGVLYDSTPSPTHLCYGVVGERNRPFADDAEWLPDPTDPDKGYWIVYNQIE